MGRGRDREAAGTPASERPVTYCIVPRELARKLHEPLRRHFADDPSVEVIVERRTGERRGPGDRRSWTGAPPATDRRRVQSVEGRRAGDRRAPLVSVEPPPGLPRKARPYVDRLVLIERLEPSGERAEDLDTARVVARFQAGDREAFSLLYIRYFDRVYSYARMLLKDAHEAEDVTQQVFMQVLQALPRYERREQPFRAWLFTVARNLAIDDLRRRNRLEPAAPAAVRRTRERDPAQVDLWAIEWLSDQDFLILIERLPLVQRQVLVLHYMLGLTNAEIATVTGRSPEAVRMLQHRALKHLKERLTALGRVPKRGERAPGLVFRKTPPVVRVRRFSLIFQGPTR